MKISGVQEAKIHPRASTKFGEQGITQRRRRERRFEVDIGGVSEAERHGFGVQ
jgi:hypothetical protein